MNTLGTILGVITIGIFGYIFYRILRKKYKK